MLGEGHFVHRRVRFWAQRLTTGEDVLALSAPSGKDLGESHFEDIRVAW
jgi:hypothetical protein